MSYIFPYVLVDLIKIGWQNQSSAVLKMDKSSFTVTVEMDETFSWFVTTDGSLMIRKVQRAMWFWSCCRRLTWPHLCPCSRSRRGEAEVREGNKAIWPPLSPRQTRRRIDAWLGGLAAVEDRSHGLVAGRRPQGQTEALHVFGECWGQTLRCLSSSFLSLLQLCKCRNVWGPVCKTQWYFYSLPAPVSKSSTAAIMTV